MTGGPAPGGADGFDRLRRRVLWAMPSGLFVIGSRAGDRRNLMTANWVLQVATEPKLVAVGLESGSVTRSLVEEGGSFAVSLLARSERGLVRRFVKPVVDSGLEVDAAGAATALSGVPVVEVSHGLPVLAAAVAWLTCSVRTVQDWTSEGLPRGASHVLVVGEVDGAGETARLGGTSHDDDVLTMGDTRMNYGG